MKQAVVTGAGGGIGEVVAQRFANEGYRVGVLDIDGENAQKAASKIDNAVALQCDVSDEASVEAAFESFGEAPNVLVNNAGILRTGPLMDHSVEDFDLVTRVNFVSVFITARAAARRMKDIGGGSIINYASINAIHPSPNCGAYAGAKGGVITLTQHMSLEWAPHKIRVNSIAPGFIDAGMSTPFYQDKRVRELRGGATPLGRLGLAEDIAKATYFLGSDEAEFITGQNITVDGGVINSVLLQLPRD